MKKDSFLHIVVVFVICLIFSYACGKKAPPVPPGTITAKPIKDLKAKLINNHILLTWTIPTQNSDGSPLLHIKEFYIFKAAIPLGSCPTCPVEYQSVIVVPFNQSLKPGMKIKYIDKNIYHGRIYVYQVCTVKGWRNQSRLSNKVWIKYK